MQKITLSQFDLNNGFTHFTDEINIESIKKYGLLPSIGENAKGIELTKKTFFAKGLDGALEICDTWLKWLTNRIHGRQGKLSHFSEPQYSKMCEEWDKQIISKEYLSNKEQINETYEKMFNDMLNRKYLVLNLKENVDFSFNDIDEVKQLCLRVIQKHPDDRHCAFLKEFYGRYSNPNSPIVEKWNLHTFSDVVIKPDKIMQLVSSSGKDDALSILIELYDINKDNEKFDMLNGFIEYSKDRIKQLNNSTDRSSSNIDSNAKTILQGISKSNLNNMSNRNANDNDEIQRA